jgi:hypothetical protein
MLEVEEALLFDDESPNKGWNTVKQKKKPKTKAQQQNNRASSDDEDAPKNRKQKKGSLSEPVEAEYYTESLVKRQTRTKRKNVQRNINTEQDMVDLCAGLIENTPTGVLTFAALGDRVQTVTNHPWNKKFK